jgi:hypothetical protein
MKTFGGKMTATTLVLGLRMVGIDVDKALKEAGPSVHSHHEARVLAGLLEQGILLEVHPPRRYGYSRSYYSLYSYHGNTEILADHRLLAEVRAFPACAPLPLQAAPPPPQRVARRPQTVLLDVLGVLQAIDMAGGLGLTQSDTFRVADLRKLSKAMNWPSSLDAAVTIDGFSFRAPAQAFAAALFSAGLLKEHDVNLLRLETPPATFAARPYHEQIELLLRGFLQTNAWTEEVNRATNVYLNRFSIGRFLLLVALAALPDAGDHFVLLDDLSEAMFARVGGHFSLGVMPRRTFPRRDASEAEKERLANEWQQQLHQQWQEMERPWIAVALTSWAYALGLVEIGLDGQTPVSVRLTDMGRALLHPGSAAPEIAPPTEPQAAWVVQPTFDVLVYLEHATPQQLAFLERHAERVQTETHTAYYRLTREAVYRALEQGSTLDELLDRLREGAAMALPQNVETELHSWAALRERITVRREVRLIEYDSQAARDAALEKKPNGTAVGDVFVLLDADAPLTKAHHYIIDYTMPLPACLYVGENGSIALNLPQSARPDLLLYAQLDRWAERQGDTFWQLTAESVRAALTTRASLSNLLDLLHSRALHTLPPLLPEVLRNWAGTPPPANLARITVLQCGRPELLHAIAKSKLFRGAIHGWMGSSALLVKTDQVEKLRELLDWAGLTVGATFQVPDREE